MDNLNYVKVLLYSYPKLDALADAVGCGAEVKALLSFRGRCDALSIAEKVAEEIVISKKLSLLKGELDRAISNLTDRELFLLEYKYFRRKEYLRGKFSGFVLGCSERSYFRMQNALLVKMASRLKMLGYTQQRFFSEFGNFSPFMRVYRAVAEGRERVVVFKRRKRELPFQNSGASCGAGADFLPRKTKTAIAANANAATQMITICIPESPDEGTSSPPGSSSPEVWVR